jgi:hypothetical protein
MARGTLAKSLVKDDLQGHIHPVRGARVMLDADLAQLYGVSTKRLNGGRSHFPVVKCAKDARL